MNTNNNEENNLEDIFGEVISMYTSEQAIEDGILFSLKEVLKPEIYEKSLLKIITVNLMNHGYFDVDENRNKTVNIPNVFDLLNQAIQIVKKQYDIDGEFDTFYSGEIELPSGEQITIWIEMNEIGGYTILLPEDH